MGCLQNAVSALSDLNIQMVEISTTLGGKCSLNSRFAGEETEVLGGSGFKGGVKHRTSDA